MFALAQTSANRLLAFEFGEPLDLTPTLEERLRWILEDVDQWRAAVAGLSVTLSIALLLDWLEDAANDAARLVPLIRALGFLRSPGVAPSLEPYLDNASREVRLETVTALGRIGALDSLPRLEPFLSSPDPALRRAAIVALSKTMDGAISPRLEAAAGVDAERQLLVRQGRRRLEAVQAGDLRAYTAAVLESEEYEDLLSMLEFTIRYVIEILGDRQRDLAVRRRALELVGIAGLAEAGPALAAILAEEREPLDFVLRAAIAAGRCHAPAAVDPLIALLDDGREPLQQAAVTSLGQIGSPRALEPLLARWNDRGGALRTGIRLALLRMSTASGTDVVARLLRANEDWRLAAVYFIDAELNLTRGYREGLLDAELSGANAARRDAILLLAYLGTPAEAAKLEARREDEDPEIRELAALAAARKRSR